MSMEDDSSVLFATLVVGGNKTKSQACALTTYWPMGTNKVPWATCWQHTSYTRMYANRKRTKSLNIFHRIRERIWTWLWYTVQGNPNTIHCSGKSKYDTLPREIQIRYIAQGNPNTIHCPGNSKYDTLLREIQIWYIAQGNPNMIHSSGKSKYDTLPREIQIRYIAQGNPNMIRCPGKSK